MAETEWVPRFEEFATELIQDSKIPGAAVALACRGNIAYARGFGHRDAAWNRGGESHRARPYADGAFVLEGLDERLRFLENDGGEVWAAAMGLRAHPRVF